MRQTASPEVALPRFESAVAELSAKGMLSSGEHTEYLLAQGDVDIQLGTTEFDPTWHDPSDIDFTEEDGLTDGVLHVPVGLVKRPLLVNIVHDQLPRDEAHVITVRKREAADLIVRSLQARIPQMDPINGQVVLQQTGREFLLDDVTVAESREDGVRAISDITLSGLSLVISDFNAMRFSQRSLNGAVALKLNHLLEREVPAGLGVVDMGSGIELNTDRKRDLVRYNERLQDQHNKIVEGLEAAGAQVIPVVVDARIKPAGFDSDVMDANLAQAIEQMNP